MPSLSYSAERLDSHNQGVHESGCFLLGGTAGEEPCAQCRFGYSPNLAVEPSHMGDRYAPPKFRPLPLITEVHNPVMDAGNKVGRLRFEPFRVPASSRHD